jgi:hypothetical protein
MNVPASSQAHVRLVAAVTSSLIARCVLVQRYARRGTRCVSACVVAVSLVAAA